MAIGRALERKKGLKMRQFLTISLVEQKNRSRIDASQVIARQKLAMGVFPKGWGTPMVENSAFPGKSK